MEIKYIKGDATLPIILDGKRSVIVHCTNTLGAWGAGFVVPLGKRYPVVRDEYKRYVEDSKKNKTNILGTIDIVPNVTDKIDVVNLFGQEILYSAMTVSGKKIIPLDYDALRKGFNEIVSVYNTVGMSFSVHMPRIGCGLAGGDWNKVEKIINDTLIKNNVEVFVYDLK